MTNSKPIVVWDGECGFCRFWIERWKAFSSHVFDYATYQEVAHNYPHIGQKRFAQSMYIIFPDGRFAKGACAVLFILALSRKNTLLFTFYRLFPPFAWLSELCYWIIARNRPLFSWLTRLLFRI